MSSLFLSVTFVTFGDFLADFVAYRIAYMINENSIQFNIVSKNLGCERMAFYLNEAAGDIRDLLLPELETKAKL